MKEWVVEVLFRGLPQLRSHSRHRSLRVVSQIIIEYLFSIEEEELSYGTLPIFNLHLKEAQTLALAFSASR